MPCTWNTSLVQMYVFAHRLLGQGIMFAKFVYSSMQGELVNILISDIIEDVGNSHPYLLIAILAHHEPASHISFRDRPG